jgi:SAM-dependent methyltransferase
MTSVSGPSRAPLPLTGERTVPGIAHENYWFRRHEAAYAYLAPLLDGTNVLEIGCGEGYGTARLARRAATVVGLDYDAPTIAHAALTYPTARFVRGNLAHLPFAGSAFGAVVALQVIEHVWHHGEFLTECRRAIRTGGLLVLTTPNRLTFSPGLDAPVNPFHTKEFAPDELVDLVEQHGFVVDELLGLHAGPRLEELDRRYDGSFVAAQLEQPASDWPEALLQDVVSVRAEDFAVSGVSVAAIGDSLDLVLLARAAR